MTSTQTNRPTDDPQTSNTSGVWFPAQSSFPRYLELAPPSVRTAPRDFEKQLAEDGPSVDRPKVQQADDARVLALIRREPDMPGQPADQALSIILTAIEMSLGERWLGETSSTLDEMQLSHVHLEHASKVADEGRDDGRAPGQQRPRLAEYARKIFKIAPEAVQPGRNRPDPAAPGEERDSFPSQDQVKYRAIEYLRAILNAAEERRPRSNKLEACSAEAKALLMLELYSALEALWEISLAYQTIEAVCDAAQHCANLAQPDGAGPQDRAGWPYTAFTAAVATVRIVQADALVFKEINGGEPCSTADAARRASNELQDIKTLISDALREQNREENQAPLSSDVVKRLETAWDHCDKTQAFYLGIARASDFLVKFERWMEQAPRFGSAQAEPDHTAQADQLADVLADAAGAISHLDTTLRDLGEDSVVASRCEPWRQLLVDIRDALVSGQSEHGSGPTVFVPKKVWVRYCFPFAVDHTHGRYDPEGVEDHIRGLDPNLAPRHAELRGALGPARATPKSHHHASTNLESPLTTNLRDELQRMCKGLAPKKSEPLPLSAFWLGSGDGLFGGQRVELPDIKLGAKKYNVWIELSRMGNNCLCVQPSEPLSAGSALNAFPHDVYRTARVATPWALGQTVGFAEEGKSGSWDSLHLFARDVVLATARALYKREGKTGRTDRAWHSRRGWRNKHRSYNPDEMPAYLAGNLHEVVVVQTESLVPARTETAADRLDKMMGTQILLRSGNRVASTLAEWIRLPAPSNVVDERVEHGTDGRVTGIPGIGFSGDWFVHTGDMTVFGVVAVSLAVTFTRSSSCRLSPSSLPGPKQRQTVSTR